MFMADTKEPNFKGRSIPREEWPAKYLQPIASDMAGLVSRPDVVSMAAGKWFAVATEPRHEALAKGEIASQGLITYLPMEPRRERHGHGHLRTVERPIIPTYLFVKCEPIADHWRRITASRGVRRVLADITGFPVPVPEGAIEVVRMFEADKVANESARIAAEVAAAEAKARIARGERSGIVWHFTPGDRVRIKNGPFAGFCAELESAVDGHDRIRALVSLFGRASTTDLSAFDIEAL
jgi:transcriptional antiterminator NusG